MDKLKQIEKLDKENIKKEKLQIENGEISSEDLKKAGRSLGKKSQSGFEK